MMKLRLTALLCALTFAAPVLSRPLDIDTAQWRVRKLKIRGVHSLSPSDLRRTMKLRPSLTKKPAFTTRSLQRDSLLIVQTYRSSGFLRPVVRVESLLRDSLRKHIRIAIAVDEGPRTRVSETTLSSPSGGVEVPFRGTVKLEVGNPLELWRLQQDVGRIQNYLADRGYLDAQIQYDIALSHDSLSATVSYSHAPGPHIHADTVVILGTSAVKPRVVERELTIKRHEVLTRTMLRNSTQNLYATDLFGLASITYDSSVHPYGSDDSSRIVQVRILERKFFTAQLGAGYHTYERARGRLKIAYTNFFGYGVRGFVEGHASFIGQGVAMGGSLPWIFGAPIGLDTKISIDRIDDEGIELQSVSGALTTRLTARLTNATRASLINEWRQDDVQRTPNPLGDTALGLSRTNSLGAELTTDTRDDLFDPHKGVFGSLTSKVGGLTGAKGNQFVKAEGDVRLFAPLRGDFVLSGALRVGMALPYGASPTIPLLERFYLGGSSVMRGFAEKRLGPRDAEDVPLGGTLYLACNLVELRFPIYRWFFGAVFLDAGNLWDLSSRSAVDYGRELSQFDLRYNAGFGLRLRLPVVIVRTDVGFKLDRRANEDETWAFQLSVGQPF